MTKEEAYKTIKENLCAMCAYGSQCMESCDIRSCDNRDAIKALEQEPSKGEKTNETDKEIHGVREELKAIEKELHNLNRILEKRKI